MEWLWKIIQINHKIMCKKFLFVCILFLGVIAIKAQDEKGQESKLRVAVFDPTSSSVAIDEGTRDAVRELISSTFVNTGKYIIVERSMLQQIMKEQKMSNTDAFDESQATELGRLAGANKVVLSVISLVGGRNMLSVKLIDVKTATIDQQKTKIVGTNDLLDIVEPLTLDLLDVSASNKPTQNRPPETPRSNSTNLSQSPTQTIPPTKLSSDNRSPIARGVMELVNSELGSNVNRYRTDEERLNKTGVGGKIGALVKFSAKTVIAPPSLGDNQVSFFCAGYEGKGKNDLVFLFIDGKMITATVVLNGFAAIVPDDGSSHQVTIWRNSSLLYSTTANFSTKNKYTFIWLDKMIQLQ